MAIIKVIRKINDAAVIIVIMLLSLFVIMQVFARYVFNHPLMWSEEICRYLQIWMVMLGGAVVMRKGGHLAIDIVTAMLPKKAKWCTDLIALVATLVFFAIVFYFGIQVAQNAGRQTSPAVRLPMVYVYSALPVGGALILMETIIRFIRFLRTGNPNDPAEEKGEEV